MGLPKVTSHWSMTPELSPSTILGCEPVQMPTFVSTHQLLGHTRDLHVAEGLEQAHLLRGDGVLPHGRVHRRAEEQGLSAVPGADDTGL